MSVIKDYYFDLILVLPILVFFSGTMALERQFNLSEITSPEVGGNLQDFVVSLYFIMSAYLAPLSFSNHVKQQGDGQEDIKNCENLLYRDID